MMNSPKIQRTIAAMQRLEAELIREAALLQDEAVPELTQALKDLEAALGFPARANPGMLDEELREQLRMHWAVAVLRTEKPGATKNEAREDDTFSFADLVRVAESAAVRFAL